jgi:hypothetical protein
MLTFTQSYNRVADIVGVNAPISTQDLTNFKYDINQALRLFKNQTRRYWTRKEVTANIVAGQQYYTMPEDMVRVTEVKANTGNGGYNWPLVQIDSEELWNRYNIIPSSTVLVPQFFFIRGRNEIGLYPQPSQNVTAGLIVSYESRLPDLSLDDVTTTTVTVTNGSNLVTSPSVNFNTNMVNQWFSVTDGTDGNWYQISAVTATQLTLENVYQGPTENTAPCIIASVFDIPEDYHLGMVYYAAYQYYLKRNENENALQYKGLFEDLIQQYREAYSAKTTGVVQKPMSDSVFNIFFLPPGTIS